MRAALRYLTGRPVDPGMASAWSVVAFPLVGAVIGLGWVLASRVLLVLPRTSAVAAAAILMVDAGLTRAVHMRGFAEVVDAATAASPPSADRSWSPGAPNPGDDLEGPAGLVPATGAGMPALMLVILLRFGVLFFAAEFDHRLLTVPLSGRAAMVWLLWRASVEERGRSPLTTALGRPGAPACRCWGRSRGERVASWRWGWPWRPAPAGGCGGSTGGRC